MAPSPARAARVVLIGLAFAACALARGDESSRDTLWHIVDRCLDPGIAGYCERCRSPLPGHCGIDACTATTDVWATTAEFVAIRDLKMCGCRPPFVHGLALPRSRVTGVEDAQRPAGIWPFAWQAARERIADEGEIALVVNPPGHRSQDQLHVHLVRLRPDGAEWLAARRPERVDRLETVWDAAERHARASGAVIWGVVVTRDPRGGFAVVAAEGSPEREFTLSRCRPVTSGNAWRGRPHV